MLMINCVFLTIKKLMNKIPFIRFCSWKKLFRSVIFKEPFLACFSCCWHLSFLLSGIILSMTSCYSAAGSWAEGTWLASSPSLVPASRLSHVTVPQVLLGTPCDIPVTTSQRPGPSCASDFPALTTNTCSHSPVLCRKLLIMETVVHLRLQDCEKHAWTKYCECFI